MSNDSGGSKKHPRLSKDRILAIVSEWNRGQTSGQLAVTFGTTRSAIMGLMYRARVSGMTVREGTTGNGAPKAPKGPKKLRYRPVKVEATTKRAKPRIAARRLPKRPKPAGYLLADLPPKGCRWIEGSPRPKARYCGIPGVKNTFWCQAHYDRVYTKVIYNR